jgi:hypothetical protein
MEFYHRTILPPEGLMIDLISVRFFIVVGLALLSGCAPVYLHHPETGKTVKCGLYFEDPASDHSARLFKRACIEDYERQGYDQISGG